MHKQVETWGGEFGDEYTGRNEIAWRIHLPLLEEVLVDILPLPRILEAGCNRGHNLKAVSFITRQPAGVEGIDINQTALAIASANDLNVRHGNILTLPYKKDTFDLVFTMGVLIHIAPEDLTTAINEMYRVSNKYVLAIEYAAEKETSVHYHGRDDLLWKRDFHEAFKTAHPDLQLIKHWKWGTKDKPFYDRLDGWLFEKEK